MCVFLVFVFGRADVDVIFYDIGDPGCAFVQ